MSLRKYIYLHIEVHCDKTCTIKQAIDSPILSIQVHVLYVSSINIYGIMTLIF